MNYTPVLLWRAGWISIGAFVGCSQPAPSAAAQQATAAPYVSARELQHLVTRSNKPVLVEFGVEIGCVRCDELRPQVEQLAQHHADHATVCRVNLNSERLLAAQLGVTVCPTYIVFVDGQEVFRVSYPTSGDLIEAQLAGVFDPSQMHEIP